MKYYCKECNAEINVGCLCSNPECDLSKRKITSKIGITAKEATENLSINLSKEKVNHPPHYNEHPSGVECIAIVEHMCFNLGNAVKYLWRADLKDDTIEDMNKAIWYIQRELERRKKLNG